VLLDFAKAVWLIDLKNPAPGAMPPGAAAFSSSEDVKKAMADLGGKVADAAGMKAYIHDYLKKNGLL
jgi:nitrous oxide reductase accessory protein NosL